MSSMILRVARTLEAKGVSLMPEYKKALDSYKEGDFGPMRVFADKVVEMVTPGREPRYAPWVFALGTAKKNALKALRQECLSYSDDLPLVKTSDVFRQSWLRKLEEWPKAIRTLELASAITDEEREVKRGPFKVIPAPGVTLKETEGALEALDAAADKIRPKFPQVLYGDVYLSTHLAKNAAAWYVHDQDTVSLNVSAKKRFDNVYTIVHEFGHRFDDKFFKNKDLRHKFWDLSTQKKYEKVLFDAKLRESIADEVVAMAKARALGKPVPSMSSSLETWLRSVNGMDVKKLVGDFLAGRIEEKALHDGAKGSKDVEVQTDKVIREPLAVTPYGGTKYTENFAEAFAHYVLGMSMQPEFVEIMAELSK